MTRSSEFSALASPHSTQSTSSEDCPKGVASARAYSEYSLLILFTNSEPNSPSVVIYLGHKPPNSNSLRPGSTTHIWIGGLINVDGLALMSICPRELQAMLHVCQQWSIRNHMQTQGKQKKWPSSKPLPSSAPRGVNTSPAQPCPPFTCTHHFNLRPPLVPYLRSLPI